jgi:hypothetical protein
LVGVEQTQDSSSLDKYNFPRKTVLLLGNEKEGIPVELIQVLFMQPFHFFNVARRVAASLLAMATTLGSTT